MDRSGHCVTPVFTRITGVLGGQGLLGFREYRSGEDDVIDENDTMMA